MSSIVENLNIIFLSYYRTPYYFLENSAMRFVVQVTTKFAVEELFSYESFHEKKNLQVEHKIRRWVFFVLRVAQWRIFFVHELHTRASTGKPRKPLSPPGLVYRHKKGTWESQEKKKTKEGEKVAPAKARFREPYTKNSFFLVHEYLGLEAARLGWNIGRFYSTRKPCAKEVPEKDYFTQRKQYLKRTILRTYSAKAVP